MILKPLSLNDLNAVYSMDQVCFPPGIAFPRHVFKYCLTSPDCLSLGMYELDRLAGFMIIQFIDDYTATVLTIEVEPEFQRRGIADELMKEMEKMMSRAGIEHVILQVETDNRPALALYEKWGYSKGEKLENYYARGIHAMAMEKYL